MANLQLNLVFDKNQIIEAEFTIDNRFAIRMGDERFYSLMGDNTMYPINRLVLEEDCESFESFALAGYEQPHVFVRCKIKNGTYRWLLFIKKAIRDVNGERFIDLEVQDIIALSYHFDAYFDRMRKYRAIINMISDKLFEYDFKTGKITFYCYKNNKPEIIDKDNFVDWKNRCVTHGFIDGVDMDKFNSLCDNILSGMDSFSATINTSFMSSGEGMDKLRIQGQTILDVNEKVLVMGMISEIGKRMQDQLEQMDNSNSEKDPATGIYNKKAITNKIKTTLEFSEKSEDESGRGSYLLILDIDDFKQVNDNYGHYFGDEVIKEFADALSHNIGSRGMVGRIGGDEFLALVQDVTEEELRIIIKSMRNGLKDNLSKRQPGYMFSTSIGISKFIKDGLDYDTLFKIADGALYIAKEKGKDRYIIYTFEKHGDLLNDTKHAHKVALGADFLKPIQKYELAVKLVLKIKEKGKESIPEVMEELMDKLNVHGISIYNGETLQCVYSSGHYIENISNAGYVLNHGYLELFDEHGINVVNNIAALVLDYKEACEILKKNNICSSLQIIENRNESNKTMVEFDIFGENRRKWSNEDIYMFRMIAIGIADILG